ncbi:hypothetical protein [Gordonia sp. (in: high G+C Gram-positive bacteria)]|uniref:hypothetical protein n=1 Tax=Gordonia sp. (in: high G+C Gram-positive bacteria) TaxID=84139 RepID=UPI0039E7175C
MTYGPPQGQPPNGQQPGQPQQPYQQPYGQQPYGQVAYPPPPAPKSNTTLIVSIVAVFVLLAALIGVVIAAVMYSSGRDSSSAVESSYVVPPTYETSTPTEDAPTTGCDAQLEKYKQLRASGDLWKQIPETESNKVAVQAYLYLLIDLCTASKFAPDKAAEYDAKAAEYERRLLAQQPLGTDVEIKLSGRTFHYNGTTGEGGYTPN